MSFPSALTGGNVILDGDAAKVVRGDGTLGAAGGASVTSAEVSALVAGLSVRIDTVSQGLSALSQAVSVADAALSSRVNSVNAALSAVSARSVGGASVHGLQSVVDALSNRISAGGGGGGSVTSQELSAVAAALSVRIDTVSNNLSALSQAVSAADAALSVRVDAVSQGLSALSQAVSVADAALSSRVNSVNAALSAVSARSVGGASVHGLQSVVDALSNRISAGGGGGGSVTSQELSAVAAALSARIDTVSNNLSVLSQAVSAADAALSLRITSVDNRVSALSAQVSVFTLGGIFLSAPSAREVPVWRAPISCTVAAVRGYRVGGTSAVVNARKNTSSALLGTDLNIGTVSSWTAGASVQNQSFVPGDTLVLQLVSVVGAPSDVVVQVDFTRSV